MHVKVGSKVGFQMLNSGSGSASGSGSGQAHHRKKGGSCGGSQTVFVMKTGACICSSRRKGSFFFYFFGALPTHFSVSEGQKARAGERYLNCAGGKSGENRGETRGGASWKTLAAHDA